jgi:imidazolonepropionase-like amidohydrolase
VDKPVDDEFLDLAKKSGAVYNPTVVVIGGYVTIAKAAAAGAAAPFDDPNGCVDPLTRARLAATPEIEAASVAGKVRERETRTAEILKIGLANLKRVSGAGIPIAMGTDAGNPGTLHGPSVYAEMEAMQSAGMTPMEVLVAATKGGSRAMSREKELGTIEKGKLADFVVVGADPAADVANMRKLKAVVRGGVYRTQEELRAIVAAEEGPKK